MAKPSRSRHNISPRIKVLRRTSLGRAAAGLRHSRGPPNGTAEMRAMPCLFSINFVLALPQASRKLRNDFSL